MSDVLDRILRQRQDAAGLRAADSVVDAGRTPGEAVPRDASSILRPGIGPESDSDGSDDFGAFGWLRGVKERAVMLELRKKTGAILAVGYAWIEFVEYDPSDGITLWIPGRKVRIQGRNLNAPADPDRPHVRLFEGLTRHRVPWVREGERTSVIQRSDTNVVVDQIAC